MKEMGIVHGLAPAKTNKLTGGLSGSILSSLPRPLSLARRSEAGSSEDALEAWIRLQLLDLGCQELLRDPGSNE